MRLLSFGLAAVAVLSVSAQQQPPPVFRGGVTLVNVDVYPRRDGRLVEGLRQEDFQVLEDGKPQKVETFEFIRIEPNTLDADRHDPNTKEEGDEQAADPHNRVFVVYLDIYHTGYLGMYQGRRSLLDFLNRVIGAHDVFAVLTPEMPVWQMTFGRRTDTITNELMTMQFFDWGLQGQSSVVPRTPVEEQLYAFCAAGPALIRVHREDLLMSSLEEMVIRLGVLRDERKNVLFISEGWVPSRGQLGLQAKGSGSIPHIGVTPGGRLGDAPIIGGGSANNSFCDKQIARLGNIDFDRRFRDLLTAARRANVSFYPVDMGGLKTFAPTAAMAGAPSPAQVRDMMTAGQTQIDMLRVLAENTDGEAVVNTNDIGGGFRKIADDLSAYYLLGYASTNNANDGKYRRIEVKVSAPRVSVSARHGYLAPSPEGLARAATAAAAVAVPVKEADELGRLSRLRADAELFAYAARTRTGLDVVAEISSKEVERGAWMGGAEARVTVAQPAGDPIVATVKIEPGARSAIVHVPLDDPNEALSRITAGVSTSSASIDGQAELPAATDAGALVGGPVIFRGQPSGRSPLRPVADFQFRRSERLHVEWPALAQLDERRARLLDRRGQPLAIAVTVSTPREDTVAADLTLAPLAAGDYLIELAAGAGGRTERHLVAFRVAQ